MTNKIHAILDTAMAQAMYDWNHTASPHKDWGKSDKYRLAILHYMRDAVTLRDAGEVAELPVGCQVLVGVGTDAAEVVTVGVDEKPEKLIGGVIVYMPDSKEGK